MRNVLLLSLLLYWFPSVAQQSFYKDFEVDSAAVPRGGTAYLTTFIQTNLRKPILAEARGIGGTVILNGIVDPDGCISNVSIMKSLRPDCDREAVRVFSLFNAWKPAQKDGRAVRQVVNIPVVFKPNTPFVYQKGVRIDYFGLDGKPLAKDSSQSSYKRVAPMDTNGIPTGDVVVYEMKNNNWIDYFRLLLIRKKHVQNGSSNKLIYSIGTQNYKQEWEGVLIVLEEGNRRISEGYYENGKRIGSDLTYYLNGSVAEKDDESDDKSTITSWYTNGQVKSIKTISKIKPLAPYNPEQVIALWDSTTGYQMVKDGDGRATYQTREESLSDTTQHTIFTEQGKYENGLKQGIWKGNYVDGSYFYEEKYNKGICLSGKARSAGADTVRYTEVMKQAEFPGGVQGLGQFLSNNLHYPVNAQKANAEGKVFISFVVCTDGALCDYEVIKSVHPDLDQEAVRVVKKMSGRWKPGVQRGEKVRVKYNLPINFTLN